MRTRLRLVGIRDAPLAPAHRPGTAVPGERRERKTFMILIHRNSTRPPLRAVGAAFCALMAVSLCLAQNRVDVYKDGVSVGFRSSINAAYRDLVPNPLNGHYLLVVAPGTYNQTNGRTGIRLDKVTPPPYTLTLRAATPGTVWLGGVGSTKVFDRIMVTADSDRVTIDGFNISGATRSGIFVEAPSPDGTGVDDAIIRNCFITGQYSGSSGMTNGILLAGGRIDRRPNFSSNRITNVNIGMWLGSGQGDVDNYGRAEHNVIYNLTGQDPATAGGIVVWASQTSVSVRADRWEISNNTIYDPKGPGIWVQANVSTTLSYQATHINARNNIIWTTRSGDPAIKQDLATTTGNPGVPYLDSSDFNNFHVTAGAPVGSWNGVSRPTLADWQVASGGKDANSLSADPLFANVPGGDFHLRSQGGRFTSSGLPFVIDASSSPSIDAGRVDSLLYVPETYPDGGRVNQGAYGGTAEASRTYVQQKNSMGDVVLVGGITSPAAIVIEARAAYALPPGLPTPNVRIQVEVKPVGTAFDGATGLFQSNLLTGGTVGSAAVSGLAPSQEYHWRYRTVNGSSGAVSDWESFGGNAESAADFRTPQ